MPLGVTLTGEGKTIILHSRSTDNDIYMNPLWSNRFGKKVLVVDEELSSGMNEINGEKVYIISIPSDSDFSTRTFMSNIPSLSDALVDRTRCSELYERVEYTFLKWNYFSLKQHVSSTSLLSKSCFGHPILDGFENCNTEEKVTSVFYKIDTTLTNCQIEFEYLTGRLLYFLLLEPTPIWVGLDGWRVNEIYDWMDADTTGETRNAFEGFRILSILVHNKYALNNMWPEVRKIGVWEKVKVQAAESPYAKKLKVRK